MRGKGAAAELGVRRRSAVRRVAGGWTRRDVAAVLGVHPRTVAEWVRAHTAGGDEARAAGPHPGRTPFPTADREEQVLGWLAGRPTAHGLRTDLRTARRVADRVRTEPGVTSHPHSPREWLATRGDGPRTAARRLLTHLRGKVVVAWDGGGSREGPAIRRLLGRNRRPTRERLPACAPDRNPVAAVWPWRKYGRLASDVPDDIPGRDDEVIDRPVGLKLDPGLMRR